MEQVLFLSRGPTYVPVGQMHVLPSLPSDQICSKQMSLLREQLVNFSATYSTSINRRTHFQNEFKQYFQDAFSVPLPTSIQQRAEYERQLIRSIRRQLRKDHLILRRIANHGNLFYLGHAPDFEAKSNHYLKNTTTYELIDALDAHQPLTVQLEKMIESIDSILSEMRQNGRLNEQQLKKLQLKTTNIELPHLYFLPQLQQVTLIFFFVFDEYSFNSI